MHCSLAYMMWVLAMLLVANSRKLYHSSTGRAPGKSVGEWVDMIVRVLGVTKRYTQGLSGVLRNWRDASLAGVTRRLDPEQRCAAASVAQFAKGATPGTSAGRAFVRSTVLLGKTVRPRYSRSNWIRCLSIVLNTFAHPTVAP